MQFAICNSPSRRGVVLLSVLIVVVLLTLAAYQFSEMMLSEYRAADSFSRTTQAKALADSGVHYTAALLSDPTAFTNTLNGNPWENLAAFQGLLVKDSDTPSRRGRFSILTLRDPEDPQFTTQPYRFGVCDEGGKLNLNILLTIAPTDTVRLQMLLKLPNMTEDVANSILDWLDSKSTTPRTNGAKDEVYSSQNPPYHVKNGPLDSLEELLLVKGVTPQLLFGNDRNRNGVIDPDEDPGDGTVDLGWQQYLTLYSRESNVDSTGNVRIYLNDTNLSNLETQLATVLDEDAAQFIVSYRLYGSSGTLASGPGAARTTFQRLPGSTATSVRTQLNTDRGQSQQKRLTSITSLFMLTTAKVAVPVPTGNGMEKQNQDVPNPFADLARQKDLLPKLFDKTTIKKTSDLPPRINVNTASRIVLSMLPNLQDADVQAILDKRPPLSAAGDAPDPIFQTPTWLLTEANLAPKTLEAIEGYITSWSQVYSFQSVGYFDGAGPMARVQAVVDTNNGRPRVLYYRPLTELGKGFNLSQVGMP